MSEGALGTASGAHRRGPAWDPVVRLTHWGAAAAILLNGVVTEDGGLLHQRIGWAAAGLLALRLVWGLVGPEEARFSAFAPSLAAARAHLGDLAAGRFRIYRSHNPLGAWMAWALWTTLAVVLLTGIALKSDPFPDGPVEAALAPLPLVAAARADEDDDHGGREAHGAHGDDAEENEMFEDVHEFAANLLLLLAALHVAGVAIESRRFGIDLVGPMVHGREGGDARGKDDGGGLGT